jgi:large subunit ribosomal protein L10
MRQEKQLLLDEVKDQIEHYDSSFVIMRYQKLNANAANEFRRKISKLGGNVEIVRKRILIKAADAAGVKLDLAALPGHIGLVYTGNDPIETTKAVLRFSEENDNIMDIVGGRFDGQLYNGEQVTLLSKLPAKDEMRAQLLATLEAPLSQTLAVMEALLASVVYCLDNKSQQSSDK